MTSAADLAPELKIRAAQLAPAIRSVLALADGTHPCVRFVPKTGLAAGPFGQGPDQGQGNGFLLGDINDPLEALYDRLTKLSVRSHPADSDLPLTIGITGLGTFTACRNSERGGRLAGKVAIITGSAQGFGEGIAREMAAQGATVVIADLNRVLAESVAESIRETHGEGSALALSVDVGSEESVASLVQDTVFAFGGLDIFVSNAGVLKAGGLEEMDLKTFEFVTRINYTAFFLCAKYAARTWDSRRLDL